MTPRPGRVLAQCTLRQRYSSPRPRTVVRRVGRCRCHRPRVQKPQPRTCLLRRPPDLKEESGICQSGRAVSPDCGFAKAPLPNRVSDFGPAAWTIRLAPPEIMDHVRLGEDGPYRAGIAPGEPILGYLRCPAVLQTAQRRNLQRHGQAKLLIGQCRIHDYADWPHSALGALASGERGPPRAKSDLAARTRRRILGAFS